MAKEGTDDLEDLFRQGDELMDKGEWAEASSIFDRILDRCKEREDEDVLTTARAHRKMGHIESMTGHFSKATTHYLEALQIFMSEKDLVETAETLRGLGYVHWRKGDFNMAVEYFNQSLERAAEAGCAEAQGKALIEMGNVVATMGRLDEAERLYHNAIKILEDSTEGFEMLRALMNLGDVHLEREEIATALGMFERCVERAKERKDKSILSWALMNVAECMVKSKDYEKARPVLSEAEAIMAENNDRMGLAAVKRVRGQAAAALKDWAEATEQFEGALRDYDEMGMPERRGVLLRLYGRMLVEKGERGRGSGFLQLALDIFEEIGAEKEKGDTQLLLYEAEEEGEED